MSQPNAAAPPAARLPTSERVLNAYVIAVLVFLALPVFIVVPLAFSDDVSLSFPPRGFSLRWFANILERPEFGRAFALSAAIAIFATIVALTAGTLAALGLVRHRFPGRDATVTFFMTPLIFPAIVLGAALALMLSPLGLLRSFWGLALAHVVLTFPYVLRTALATLSEIDRALAEAAYTLGANRWKTFRHVTLPLMRPGLLAGATFALIVSFDEFTISMFLVGPGMMTLPLEMYNYAEFSLDPTIAAISTILLIITSVAIIVIEKLVGLGKQFS
ncbi:ABC transporter permease [Enterovirga rhinocerotis]|uniref:Putative spermidine/putrescine transport system permease protein n=1 Tax=Enterovirga rhinocerotis TaxID=1339210 RepID=A0A4R7BJ47_9HYPH|nr:ABC transporter permease [Enterovirga rhinocerotis]TDR85380.1 putative spermidine/putrescine transport system permease protein [Enterovirga rhinocerotis]